MRSRQSRGHIPKGREDTINSACGDTPLAYMETPLIGVTADIEWTDENNIDPHILCTVFRPARTV